LSRRPDLARHPHAADPGDPSWSAT